jgi:solute carrier family 25 (adenine nucleotide translocator) protein 4/5/6/31
MEENVEKLLSQLFSGGGAGAFAKTCVAPMERIKVLLQAQASNPNIPPEQRYKGMVDAAVKIPKEEGVRAFWRGNGMNVIRIFPNAALKFTLNDQLKAVVMPKGRNGYSGGEKFARGVVAGGFSGAVMNVFVYPMDLVRTRLTTDVSAGGKREYKGLIDCFSKIIKTEGVGGLYKGGVFSTFTIMPYLGISFASYDSIKTFFNTKFEGTPLGGAPGNILAGAAAGVFAQSVTYPLDTLRRRVQMDGMSGAPKRFKGIAHAARLILKEEGVGSFFGGVTMNAIKAAPGSGLQFAAYDFLKGVYAKMRHPEPAPAPKLPPKAGTAAAVVTKAEVPRAETERLTAVFKGADLNKDGHIGKGELVIALAKYGYTWNEVDVLFERYDKDKSGDIDFEEFKELILEADIEEKLLGYEEHAS